MVRYGVDSADARLKAANITMHDGRTHFDVIYDGKKLGALELGVPGLHNVRNALAAMAVGIGTWGVTVEQMSAGLAHFVGAERRFQRIGDVAGVTVIDDYAHHPTEIRATLSAARDAFPGRRIVAAFQPHLFSRTRDFAVAFGDALAAADQTFLADIYPAREQPIAGVSSDLIASAMSQAGRGPVWRGARSDLAVALSQSVAPGDVVLTMGAGDITKTAPELLALLGR